MLLLWQQVDLELFLVNQLTQLLIQVQQHPSFINKVLYYANGEFIQIHPTAIPGDDKLRLMSESARGEGGRVWTYKDGKPWYFLEEKYPAYGNLVPRDIATREIFDVCVNHETWY